MITKTQLLLDLKVNATTSHCKGVLTLSEAQKRFDQYQDIIVISNRKANQLFFTDSHQFGREYFSTAWIPRTIKANDLIERLFDEQQVPITTVAQFVDEFYRDYNVIVTIDNLLEIINQERDVDCYVEHCGIKKDAAMVDIYLPEVDQESTITLLTPSTSAYHIAKRISKAFSTNVSVRYNTLKQVNFEDGVCIQTTN